MENMEMSEDQNSQLVGIFKTLIKDLGMPKTVDDITDPIFHAAAAPHIDEFDEARAECETDLQLL
jgi:hypothetical protein